MSYYDEIFDKSDTTDGYLRIACSEVDRLRLDLASAQAELKEARRDSERLDAIPHGWRIGHEQGAQGHPDHWYIWTADWSRPLGEGETFREALDAARGTS